jgi:anti-anti-sigma factor
MVSIDNNVIYLKGQWNMATGEQIIPPIRKHFENYNGEVVRIDLSEMEYMDSSGISELIRMQQELKKSERTLQLVNPTEIILKILKLVRVDQIIPIERS